MSQEELREELKRKRTALHHAEMRLAGRGISADPWEIMQRDDLLGEVRSLEGRVGEARTPTPQEIRREYPPSPRYVAPEPELAFQQRMVGQQLKARQDDIAHQMTLLNIHRRNLGHLRAQLRELGAHAPPYVRNGVADATDEIAKRKGILREMGQAVDDLPGDG